MSSKTGRDNDSDDDGPLTLPADTLRALADFQHERAAEEDRFEQLKNQAEAQHAETLSMVLFKEDWNASQFWYTDETADVLAEQLLNNATADTNIAVISAPSVYVAMKRICKERMISPRMTLFEYDKRFSVLPGFQFYDFNAALQLPSALKASFDRIICDPPFLSEDCQTKTALTTKYLARTWSQDLRFISCTGERMESVVLRLYGKLGVNTTSFEPR